MILAIDLKKKGHVSAARSYFVSVFIGSLRVFRKYGGFDDA